MKKVLFVAAVLFAVNAYACQIVTIIQDGRIVNCTICGNVINCN
jgi:hypothetical protein